MRLGSPARDHQDRRGAAAVHADGRGEPGQRAGHRLGQHRRRPAARLRLSKHARRARWGRRLRHRAYDPCRPELPGHDRHAPARRTVDRRQRSRGIGARRDAVRAAGAAALLRRRSARRPRHLCARRRRAQGLHRRRRDRRSGVDADGQSAAAAVPAAGAAAGLHGDGDRARRAVRPVDPSARFTTRSRAACACCPAAAIPRPCSAS